MMPAGLLVTVPTPLPEIFTLSVGGPLNVAPTFASAFVTTVHVPVPVQAPFHPAKTDPVPGEAVSCTDVAVGK